MNSKLTFATFATACLLSTSLAAASAQQRLPGVIDRTTPEPLIPLDRELGVVPQSEIDPLQPVGKVKNPNQVVAKLKAIKFEGEKTVSDDALQDVVSSYLNRPITNQDIAQLKYDVTKYFYEHGYILVRVVTPQQNLSSGVLRVQIFQANVGKVTIHNEGVLNDTVANAIASRLGSGDVFEERPVESVVSDLNDLPGIKATLNLSPGQEFKTTNLNFITTEADEDVQQATIDNYGSELTGKVVAGLHLQKSNLFHLGEQFYTNLRKSDDQLWSVEVGARTPIAIENLMLDVSYLHSDNDIGDRLKALNASGTTDTFTTGLTSQLINMRHLKWETGVGLEVRKNESYLSNVTDTKDDIRKLYLSSSLLTNSQDHVLLASVKLLQGVDIFGATDKGAALATRAGADPEAIIFQPLVYGSLKSPFSDGDFKAQVSGQLTSNEVLSSDLFVLGGYGSVRGFEPAEETGDSGYQFSFEYNHNLPITFVPDVTFRAGPFLDGGAVYNRIQGQVQDTHLYSAGLGFEAAADLLPVGKTVLRVDLARTINDYNSSQVKGGAALFRLSQDF